MLIRPVTVAELLTPEGRALFARHHAEIGLEVFGDGRQTPLDIDERAFRVAEAMDALLALGAFTDSGELVGYAVGGFYAHPLAQSRSTVASRALFLAPEHRKQGNGLLLIDAFEAAAGLRDAVVHWHAHEGPAGRRFERILERRGAHKLETIYVSKER